MTKTKAICSLVLALAVIVTAAHATPPNNNIVIDGTVNVGTEWTADERVAVQSAGPFVNDYGAGKHLQSLYVTWNATTLFLGLDGNVSDMNAWSNDAVIIFIDTEPGATTNPGPFATFQLSEPNNENIGDSASSNLGNAPKIIFPDAFRPDFFAGALFNDWGGGQVKLPGAASNKYAVGVFELADFGNITSTEGSLDAAGVRGTGAAPNQHFELSIPLADLFGGAPPANAKLAFTAYVGSGGWCSDKFLPPLTTTNPAGLENVGQNTISPDTTPQSFGGVVVVNLTNASGTLLTSVTSVVENTFTGVPLDAASVDQVYDPSTLRVSFTDGLVLDNNAQTVGNYTVTVGGSPATLSSAQIGVSNKDVVYLTLSAPATAGQAISVTVSTAVTANGGTSTLGGPDTVSTTAQRRVLWTMDRSASGEDSLTIAGPFSEPFIRGAWDGFSGRIQFSDAADAFADIPGTQALGTGGDDIYEAVAFISDATAHDYIINSEVPNAPGSDGGANQFVGVGYWMNTPYNLTLATSATAINLVDDVWNRRLIQDTTVSFIARFPSVEANGYWATPAELQSATIRLQGGTRLGGFSPEGVIEPMVTGGATAGSPMQFIGQDGAGFSYYFGQVTFPAGVLDVFEFRLVANGIVGAIDAYEDQDGDTASVHQHTARATNFDRVTPNDQFVTWEVISYDVNPTVANITAADNWDLFE